MKKIILTLYALFIVTSITQAMRRPFHPCNDQECEVVHCSDATEVPPQWLGMHYKKPILAYSPEEHYTLEKARIARRRALRLIKSAQQAINNLEQKQRLHS